MFRGVFASRKGLAANVAVNRPSTDAGYVVRNIAAKPPGLVKAAAQTPAHGAESAELVEIDLRSDPLGRWPLLRTPGTDSVPHSEPPSEPIEDNNDSGVEDELDLEEAASFLQPRSREGTRELTTKSHCWTRRCLIAAQVIGIGVAAGASLAWWSSPSPREDPPCVPEEPEPPPDGPLQFTFEFSHAAFDGAHQLEERRNEALLPQPIPAMHPRSSRGKACAGNHSKVQKRMRRHCPRRHAPKDVWHRRESASHPGSFYYVNRATGGTQTYPPAPWVAKASKTHRNQSSYWNSETNETASVTPEIVTQLANLLFCWSFVVNTDSALTLLRTLHRHRRGIFGCDEYALVSELEIELGEGLRTSAVVPKGQLASVADVLWSPVLGMWRSADRLAPVLHAWRLLRADCRLENHQWVVKVEPETVFFPERLRVQLRDWQWKQPEWPKAVMLRSMSHGRLVDGGPEILSRGAVDRLSNDWAMACLDVATNGPETWGLHKCMPRFDVEVKHGFKVHVLSNDSRVHVPEVAEDCRQKGLIAVHGARSVKHHLACAYSVEDDPDATATAEDCQTAEEGDACYRNVTWVLQEGLKNYSDAYEGLTPLSRFEDVQGHVHAHNKSLCPKPCPCHILERDEKCSRAVRWAKEDGVIQHPEWYGGLNASSSIEAFQAHLHQEVLEGNPSSACPRACATLPRRWVRDSSPHVEPQSLYCFVLVQPRSYEIGLVKMQAEQDLGIFRCDGSDVFSNVSVQLADGVHTLQIDMDLTVPDDPGTHTAANAPVFIALWQEIYRLDRFNSFAWAVKADPDTVFLPWRLVDILKRGEFQPSERGVFLRNCGIKFHGPLEVLSRKALMTWGRDHQVCPWHPQEDWYMDSCLISLKVPGPTAKDLLGDRYCREFGGPSCTASRAAFHYYKSSSSWRACWDTANHSWWAWPRWRR